MGTITGDVQNTQLAPVQKPHSPILGSVVYWPTVDTCGLGSQGTGLSFRPTHLALSAADLSALRCFSWAVSPHIVDTTSHSIGPPVRLSKKSSWLLDNSRGMAPILLLTLRLSLQSSMPVSIVSADDI